MRLSINGICKIAGLATGFGIVSFFITEDIKRSARKHAQKLAQRRTEPKPSSDGLQVFTDLQSPKPWQTELGNLLDEEGMGRLHQELQVFSEWFLTIGEMQDFREELDDLAALIGHPFKENDIDTASIWSGIIAILHLRNRTVFEKGSAREYYVKQLNNHASFIPPLAARIGLKRGVPYAECMAQTTQIVGYICNQGRQYYEERTIPVEGSERLVGAAT